ncbi:MAG TPA: MFS transporter [Stellaceae bacterium]|jgi:ACS family glucarate transporter-like MFS transporter
MKPTRRRYWVFFLLFLFNVIAYVDRVNMSVAGKPIAHEFGLSPIALGYLFSSFLWAYVLMMLPGGRLIDRWGTHVLASVATAVWSAAQMATGIVGSFATMMVARLGLGVGEAPFAPVTYGSVRSWSPYRERGTTIAAISAGPPLGLALGAPLVGWLIESLSWRWSFIITGAVGFAWVAVWLSLVSTMEKTRWLPQSEREHILAERDAGVAPPSHGGIGYLGLIRCPAMWGLFISQGCLVYTFYLYMSWLPNYLQTTRGISIVGSGLYTAIPFVFAAVVCIIANWFGDRLLSAAAVRAGKRRYLVALCLLLTAVGLAIPFVRPLAGVMALVTVAVSFANVGPAAKRGIGRRHPALARRRGPGLRVSGSRRQHLWPAGADRDRLHRRRHRQLQLGLCRRRRAGADRGRRGTGAGARHARRAPGANASRDSPRRLSAGSGQAVWRSRAARARSTETS